MKTPTFVLALLLLAVIASQATSTKLIHSNYLSDDTIIVMCKNGSTPTQQHVGNGLVLTCK